MSWVFVAPDSEFPIQNLPYGCVAVCDVVFRCPLMLQRSVFERLEADPWKPKASKDKRAKKDKGTTARIGVRIGDTVLDMRRVHAAGLLDEDAELSTTKVFLQPTLNAFMALSPEAWSRARSVRLLCLSQRVVCVFGLALIHIAADHRGVAGQGQ